MILSVDIGKNCGIIEEKEKVKSRDWHEKEKLFTLYHEESEISMVIWVDINVLQVVGSISN